MALCLFFIVLVLDMYLPSIISVVCFKISVANSSANGVIQGDCL